jgi:molybdenum-dependent DNA-binding transcriptional regulator ModE
MTRAEGKENGESSLSTRSLRYLHEIDTHGGVRAAADALGINASVVSRQVAQLEREHGVALLERHGRRVAMTEVGLSLAEHFREGARRDAEMLAQLEDYRGLRRGTLGIGVGEGRVEICSSRCWRSSACSFPTSWWNCVAARRRRSWLWGQLIAAMQKRWQGPVVSAR